MFTSIALVSLLLFSPLPSCLHLAPVFCLIINDVVKTTVLNFLHIYKPMCLVFSGVDGRH